MEVAIIGAGISGLSCAFELKKNGISPVIFEKRSEIGDRFGFLSVMMNIFNRDIFDPVKYLKKEVGLKLAPLYPLKEINIAGPSKKLSIKGNMGYIFGRGAKKNSIENQIASGLDLHISFDTYISLDDIKKDFDHIVVATGDTIIADELRVWKNTFYGFCKMATVLGNFKTGTLKMWFNTGFAKNGFCYMVPANQKEAVISLIVNDIAHQELDFYWKEFLLSQKIPYKVIETRDAEHRSGTASPIQIGNIYFVGNTGGMTDAVMGFGALKSIQSGILAARAISDNLSYSQLIRPIVDEIDLLLEYRKMINSYDNKSFDRLISFLSLPLVKQMIYKNPLFKATQACFITKLYNTLQKSKGRQMHK